MDVHFTETQNLTQQKLVKWAFGFAFLVYLSGFAIGLAKDKSLFEAHLIIFMVTLLLYFLLQKLRMKTEVDSTELKVNHPFIGSFSIPINQIVSTEKINFNFPNNRRSYHKKFGTLYRMYGNNGLFIQLQKIIHSLLAVKKQISCIR